MGWTGLCGPLLALLCHAGAAETTLPPFQVLISVPDQRLAVVRDGELVARFPVSTSRFGTGDSFYSYKTPLGELKVCDKIGENLPVGAVIHHRAPTGEVLPVNAPGRDPIVTRVIWLDGLEAQNKNAHSRGIYIHGTPQEWTIGKPMSWGCIRMRSQDVIKVFDEIPLGTVVSISPDKLPHMHRYHPPKQQPPENEKGSEPPAGLIASAAAPKPSVAAPKPSAAPEKTLAETSKASATPGSASGTPLPAIGESADKGNTSPGWRALKGSFLLANLPGSEKSGDHRKRAVQTQ